METKPFAFKICNMIILKVKKACLGLQPKNKIKWRCTSYGKIQLLLDLDREKISMVSIGGFSSVD